MQIVITYEGGTGEVVSARLEGDVVSVGQRWVPGILTNEPERCYFKSDYFLCAINEGHEREGVMRAEPGDIDPDTGKPEWMGFTWKLLGNEADACRAKIRNWIGCLYSGFDPEMKGIEYLHGGLLHVLEKTEIAGDDRDRECWLTYLDDPRSEAAALLREAGYEPPEEWENQPAIRP